MVDDERQVGGGRHRLDVGHQARGGGAHQVRRQQEQPVRTRVTGRAGELPGKRQGSAGVDGYATGGDLDGGANDVGVLTGLQSVELAGPAGAEHAAGTRRHAGVDVLGEHGRIDRTDGIEGRHREEQHAVEILHVRAPRTQQNRYVNANYVRELSVDCRDLFGTGSTPLHVP